MATSMLNNRRNQSSSAGDAEVPIKLKPYLFHRLDVDYKKGEERAEATCPWCGNDSGKFTIKVETGQWRCFSCNEGEETDKAEKGGNVWTFIRMLWARSFEETTADQYKLLAEERGYLSWESLAEWGLAVSYLSGDWIVPGYSGDGKLMNLYAYRRRKGEKGANGKRAFFGTTGLPQQMFGMGMYDPNCEIVYLTEGIWDGIALWETLGNVTLDSSTGKFNVIDKKEQKTSLLTNASVVSIAGNLSFSKDYLRYFKKKEVYLLGHNDAPKEPKKTNTKKKSKVNPLGASASGMRRICQMFSHQKKSNRPKAVYFLNYGEGPGGYSPELKDGFDIRDLMQMDSATTFEQRAINVASMFENIADVPEKWFSGGSDTSGANSDAYLDYLPCTSYKQLTTAWRKALKWTDGLDRGLSAMLASIASVRILGDQLWLKIIGPASCGKSTLCEAVSVNKEYVFAKSTIRGFHSGWKNEKGDEEDNSLIAQVRDKTLVTKDGDTLLQSPNLGQILSEARDIYDSTSRSHYRNKASRDYTGVRMTWLLCGTASLRQIDSSELGERFLDCVIMDGIDDDLEDEVLHRVAFRTERNMALESNDNAESQHDPDMATAMKMTAGYINYLRENTGELLASTRMNEERIQQCIHLGKFVAHLRARPSRTQEETSEREFAARLVSQITRLAKCEAIVLNRPYVDDEVMRRTRQIALDTGRGIVLELIEYLYQEARLVDGASSRAIALKLGRTEEAAGKLLRFLHKIRVVLPIDWNNDGRAKTKQRRWILTKKIRKLYESVLAMAPDTEE